jgi:hypothetical protein
MMTPEFHSFGPARAASWEEIEAQIMRAETGEDFANVRITVARIFGGFKSEICAVADRCVTNGWLDLALFIPAMDELIDRLCTERWRVN